MSRPIAVRVVFRAGDVVLFTQTRDPFFLAVLGIVGAGLVTSTACFALDLSSRGGRART